MTESLEEEVIFGQVNIETAFGKCPTSPDHPLSLILPAQFLDVQILSSVGSLITCSCLYESL